MTSQFEFNEGTDIFHVYVWKAHSYSQSEENLERQVWRHRVFVVSSQGRKRMKVRVAVEHEQSGQN